MNRKIPTIRRPWYMSAPMFWYLAGVAGFVAGAIVLAYAPEFAAWYKEMML